MIFLVYTILVILQFKGITTMVSNPCSSNLKNRQIVADMCNSSFATEESHSGGYKIDSVVLRIMIQQDNCICRVTLDNQIQPVQIGLRKYDGLASSAPAEANCGLAVDINHIPDMSTGSVIAPIECIKNVDIPNILLLENSTLQFKSRIINGTFTRGYCMQTWRDMNSNHSQVLRIDCDAPTTTEQITNRATQSDPTTYTSGNDEYSSMTTSTSTQTTGDNTATASKTDTSKLVKNMSMTTEPTTGLEKTAYIAIGAGSGVALILLIVLVVVCIRRKSTQKAGTNGNVNKSYQQEESDDKLQDNVLYVPATEFDITGGNYSNRLSHERNYRTVKEDIPKSPNNRLGMEGNYSTVDEDIPNSPNNRLSMEGNYSTVDEDMPNSPNNRLSMDGNYSTVELDAHLANNSSYPEKLELGQTKGKEKPTIKPKPKSFCKDSEQNRSSDQNIKHVTPPNGSDNVYAVVDKRNKYVHTTNGCQVEGAGQAEQTYAVVDKVRKRKSGPDETNKKKFEINAGKR